jgi:hypothetical protein
MGRRRFEPSAGARAESCEGLAALPLRVAQEVKWQRGRAQYGGEGFQGDPLEELFLEMLDALNYCEECMSRGMDLAGAYRDIRRTARRVRRLMRQQSGAEVSRG